MPRQIIRRVIMTPLREFQHALSVYATVMMEGRMGATSQIPEAAIAQVILLQLPGVSDDKD